VHVKNDRREKTVGEATDDGGASVAVNLTRAANDNDTKRRNAYRKRSWKMN
jgi:hypothetical protein